MKKQFFGILVGAVLALSLTACGDKKTDTASTGSAALSGELTKAEWVGELGDNFGYDNYDLIEDPQQYYSDVTSSNEYYNQIESCYAWGVINDEGTFSPDSAATYEYAVKTAVRAIGIDRINNAGGSVSEDNLVDFFNNNIANLSSVNMSDTITADIADELITYARNYRSELAETPVFETTVADGVSEIEASDITFKGDGKKAIVNNGVTYNEGDIIYVKPSDSTAAAPIKVSAVNGSEITYTYVDVTEVYDEVVLSGTYEGNIISAQAANSDSTVVGILNSVPSKNEVFNVVAKDEFNPYSAVLTTAVDYAMGVADEASISFTSSSATFELPLKGGGTLTCGIKDIKVTPEYDMKLLKVQKAGVEVNFTKFINVDYDLDDIYSKTIPLGSVDINVGTTGFMVRLSLTANIGVSGEITIDYQTKVSAGVNYVKGNGVSYHFDGYGTTCDFHAEATVTAEATAKIDLRFGVSKLSTSIANVKATIGVVGVAKIDADLMGKQPTCIDIFVYVPLKWALNGDKCVITDIIKKAKYEQTLWDSTNSPVQIHYHYEDGTPVDECTRGKDEEVVQPNTDEEGKPFDEYEYFDFEDLEFGFIDVESSIMILDGGESATIGIISVPDGYSESDLVYTSNDTNVCTVSGGVVTAGSNAGSTTIKVATSDGNYSTYITVTVNAGYNDTTGFQDL